MQPALEFYFDFVSPYAYLGSRLIDDLARGHGRTAIWHPVLIGVTVLKIMGLKPMAQTPLKGPYSQHDVPRVARYLDLPFKRPEGSLKSLAAMRAFVWLDRQDTEAAVDFARAVFQAQWAEGRNLSHSDAVIAFAAALGHDERRVSAAINSPDIKQALRARVDAAVAAGVFGVPSVAVDGELFWGVDRFPMIGHWLDRSGW